MRGGILREQKKAALWRPSGISGNKKAPSAGNRGAFNYHTVMEIAQFALLPERITNMPGGLPFVFSYSCYSFYLSSDFRNLLLHFSLNCVKHFSFEDIQRPFHSVSCFLGADAGEINQRGTDVLHALAFAIS